MRLLTLAVSIAVLAYIVPLLDWNYAVNPDEGPTVGNGQASFLVLTGSSPKYLKPANSSWGFMLPSLTNQPCIGTDGSGIFQAGTCGSGSGGGLASTSPWTRGALTAVNSDAALYAVATTTLTASSPLSLSNPVVKVGGSNSVLTISTTTNSLFTGTPGQVLAYTGAGWTGVATTTFSGGLTYSAGNVTNTLTAGDGITRNTDDLDCDTASGSVFGCLSSTDWTTFNNKLGSYDAWTHPTVGVSATTSSLRMAQASTTILSAQHAFFGATATSSIGTTGLFSGVTGAEASPTYSFTGDTGTGMFRVSGGTLGFSIAGTGHAALNSTNFYPYTNDATALGIAANGWSDLFLASGAVIGFGNGNLSLTQSTDKLTLSSGDNLTVDFSTTTYASFTNASSTNWLNITTDCDADNQALGYDITTMKFTCGDDDTGVGGGGITDLGPAGQQQNGTSQLFATSSDTNIGLTITSSGDTHTFTSNWIGTLADARVSDTLTIGSGSTVADGALSANVSLLGSSIDISSETNLSASWPLVLSGDTLSWNATSSPWAANGFVYTNAAGLLVTAASSTLSLPNTALQNSTISGVALGSNLNSLSNGSTLSGSSYNGSATVSDWDIDLSNPNTWTGKQNFYGAASSTLLSAHWAKFGATASTTIDTAGNVALPAAGTLTIPALTSALLLTDGNGLLAEYAGSSCTNQTVTAISALGAATCTTINGNYLDLTANYAWTGAHDFGGGVLEIPNGSNPTVDAIGEIALDTTQNELLIATSTNAGAPIVIKPYEWKGFTFGSTTQGSGTTTKSWFIAPPSSAGYFDDIVCHSNSFMRVLIKDEAGNRMNDLVASSTEGSVKLATNNAFTGSEVFLVDTGTTTNIAANVYGSCWVKIFYTRN